MTNRSKSVADLLWDVAVIGIAEVGLNGSWIKVNPAICKMLEYTQTELQSMKFQDITHPADLNDDKHMAQKLIDGDLESYVMTKRYITKTGKIIWVKLNVDAVLSDDSEVLFFLSQISPVYEIENFKGNRVLERKNGRSGNIERAFLTFLKSEWKWLLGAAIASVLAFAKYYHEVETSKELREKQEHNLIELEQQVNDLKIFRDQLMQDESK